MDQFRTLSAILRGSWAINPAQAEMLLPLVSALLLGGTTITPGGQVVNGSFDEEYRKYEETYKFNKEYMIQVAEVKGQGNGYHVKYYDGFKDAPKGSIGIIPIQGVMMKNDYCGDAGSLTNARRVAEANDNPNIDAIVLRVDSPGGMVDGLPTLYDAIKNSAKPVISFIDDGGMYSAAYYVSSAADMIFSSHNTNGVGSIGTMQRLMDYRDALNKAGIKITDIYAPQSTEKNKEYRDFMDSGKTDGYKAMLQVYAQDFIDRVIAGRVDKLNVDQNHKALKGATFFADEAVQLGLIDGIAPFDQVLAKASALAQKEEGIYI